MRVCEILPYAFPLSQSLSFYLWERHTDLHHFMSYNKTVKNTSWWEEIILLYIRKWGSFPQKLQRNMTQNMNQAEQHKPKLLLHSMYMSCKHVFILHFMTQYFLRYEYEIIIKALMWVCIDVDYWLTSFWMSLRRREHLVHSEGVRSLFNAFVFHLFDVRQRVHRTPEVRLPRFWIRLVTRLIFPWIFNKAETLQIQKENMLHLF